MILISGLIGTCVAILAMVVAAYRRIRAREEIQAQRCQAAMAGGFRMITAHKTPSLCYLASSRHSEMKALLLEVRAAAEALIAAQANELSFESQVPTMAETVGDAAFDDWMMRRRATANAQVRYDHALLQYQEFIESLPSSSRQVAVAWLAEAIVVRCPLTHLPA
jgi:hypothetical protein